MPTFATITINDGESTPVAHAFAPDSKDPNGVALFIESDGVPANDNMLSLSLRKTTDKRRCRLVMKIPEVQTETINGISRSVVVREAIADLTVTFSKESTTQERTNLIRLMSNALAGNATVDGVLVSLEGIHG